MVNVNVIFDPEELERNVAEGFVSRRSHPTLPIDIYNYTPEATFQNRWDEVTLSCRGLILDRNYNILARPFRKFFNLNTGNQPDTFPENLPKDIPPDVTEKMDGSLGILWGYDGEWGIATRGSFTSEQAVWATEFAKKVLQFPLWRNYLTPLFEIIYPANRIILDYHGAERLTLLGIVYNEDGSEYTYQELKETGYPDIVPIYAGKALSDCVSESETFGPLNMEGYVLRYSTQPYPLRIKIKFADYLRLHRMTFSLNSKVIWETLRDGKDPMEHLEGLPDDAFRWIMDTISDLRMNYSFILKHCRYVFADKPEGSRKDMALYFKDNCNYPNICFSMLDGKDYGKEIWKVLEPKPAVLYRRSCFDAE